MPKSRLRLEITTAPEDTARPVFEALLKKATTLAVDDKESADPPTKDNQRPSQHPEKKDISK